MRITSAPNCAMVMPPSGAATKALNSTMRRSAKSRFIAAPPFAVSALLSRNQPRAPHPDRVDEKRAQHDREHQPGPEPPDRTVRDRALRRRQLHDAQRKRTERRQGVDLNDGRRGQEWSKVHRRIPATTLMLTILT